MPYKSWNVVKAGDEYRDKEGNNKRRWDPIGTLLYNEEKDSFSIKLHMFEGWFNCFVNDRKEKVEVAASTEAPYGGAEPEKSKW